MYLKYNTIHKHNTALMAGVGVQEGGAVPVDGYTKDGSVDLKGNPVRRSHTGRWTACFFIVGT